MFMQMIAEDMMMQALRHQNQFNQQQANKDSEDGDNEEGDDSEEEEGNKDKLEINDEDLKLDEKLNNELKRDSRTFKSEQQNDRSNNIKTVNNEIVSTPHHEETPEETKINNRKVIEDLKNTKRQQTEKITANIPYNPTGKSSTTFIVKFIKYLFYLCILFSSYFLIRYIIRKTNLINQNYNYPENSETKENLTEMTTAKSTSSSINKEVKIN